MDWLYWDRGGFMGSLNWDREGFMDWLYWDREGSMAWLGKVLTTIRVGGTAGSWTVLGTADTSWRGETTA